MTKKQKLVKKPVSKLSKKAHRNRHVALHHSLDELAADMMNLTHKLPSETTVMELMQWSHNQTLNPTEFKAKSE